MNNQISLYQLGIALVKLEARANDISASEDAMLDLKFIRENADLVRQSMVRRHQETSLVDEVIALDDERRRLILESETRKSERNTVSKQISQMKDPAERQTKINAMRSLGDEIAQLDAALKEVEARLRFQQATIPNIPDPDVPDGKDDSENVVLETFGEPRKFDFEPKAHWDLGPALGILDFDEGVKLSGTRFYVLKGAGARLQRALIFWMVDLHIRQGWKEYYTPWMVKEEVLFAAGELPKFAPNLYHDAESDFWWVPTAEVPLTGVMMDTVTDEADLPMHLTAYSACFRREKMSAGRDVRGMKRGHQFDKVEMYTYCRPEDSDAELARIVKDACQTCADLGLTYRTKLQCTGDLGEKQHKTIDIEVWAPGVGEWLEVSSCSKVGDYQARRSNMKYRPADGSASKLLHTLNGSGLGLPRTLIAVMENYQQADGSIVVPEVLKPFMGGIDVIRL